MKINEKRKIKLFRKILVLKKIELKNLSSVLSQFLIRYSEFS